MRKTSANINLSFVTRKEKKKEKKTWQYSDYFTNIPLIKVDSACRT